MESFMMCFIKGQISLTDFEFLSGNRSKILALCEISDDLQTMLHKVKEAYKAREQEKEAFEAFHRILSDFWSSCKTAVKGSCACGMANVDSL